MRKLHLSLLPAIFLLVLGLAACGSSGNGDEGKVEEAIEKAATATDPAACTKYQTRNFLEQTNQESGKAAVKTCEEEVENKESAESADVSNVEVDGSKATAEVALTGSAFNGQTVEVGLVEDGGQWKVNEVVKFTKFNQAKLVQTFERELSKASNEVSPKFAACFIEAFEQADQGEIEAMLFGGNEKAFEEIAGNCH